MKNPYDRRTVLKLAGTGTITLPIAGCASNGGDGEGGEDGEDGEDGTGDGEDGGEDGASDEPNHEVPHPGDNEVPEAEATGEPLAGGQREPGSQSEPDNASVMLQHMPSGQQSCGSCALYVPDQDGDGFGACTSVAGKINPCDWCLLYVEYSGDDWDNPCGQI